MTLLIALLVLASVAVFILNAIVLYRWARAPEERGERRRRLLLAVVVDVLHLVFLSLLTTFVVNSYSALDPTERAPVGATISSFGFR
jgi:heme/copper-type cytochrome/quinol oxidase subunit 2